MELNAAQVEEKMAYALERRARNWKIVSDHVPAGKCLITTVSFMGRREAKLLALCRADNNRIVELEWRDDAAYGSNQDVLRDWMKETPVGIHDLPLSLLTEPAPSTSELQDRLSRLHR